MLTISMINWTQEINHLICLLIRNDNPYLRTEWISLQIQELATRIVEGRARIMTLGMVHPVIRSQARLGHLVLSRSKIKMQKRNISKVKMTVKTVWSRLKMPKMVRLKMSISKTWIFQKFRLQIRPMHRTGKQKASKKCFKNK